MGVLRECKVISLSDSKIYDGHAWSRDDGSYEAFWHEGGNRVTQFFYANGQPQGFFNKYKISFP